ncbi:MAG: hypothetical protein B7O98_00760 [Zestosphaera tikiterensis]|uniref:Rubrerythrin diiron-binding domain-containing protein n=1 Tax=Zestosphaera tikiterensis TaxID=1973259 RepID=A0A2R7Y9A4_9CREN|nr:MAG: hypothetical protein B7O98_00760 [Zestosphaera tikiterensis]
MVEDIIRKALDVEKKALDSYMHAIRVLKLQGIEHSDLDVVIKKVLIDTLIHGILVDSLLKAYKEAISKEVEVLKSLEDVKPTAREASLIVKLLKDHLTIESDMIETYNHIYREVKHPVFKALAEALMVNEQEHHKLLSELIRKYEKV